jgi:putative colanic acid biosynthesis UDP-glucose lipid carrier transferase
MVSQDQTSPSLRSGLSSLRRGRGGAVLPTDTHALLPGLLRLVDAATVAGGAALAFWLQHGTLDMPSNYQVAILLSGVLTLNFLHVAGVYRWSDLEKPAVQMFRTGLGFLAVFAVMIAIAYFTGTSDWFSRGWVVQWFALAAVTMGVVRLGALIQLWRLRQQGDLALNIAVVGARGMGGAVVRQLREGQGDAVTIVGVFDDIPDLPERVGGIEVRGRVDDLVRLSREERIDEIVLAMADRSAEEVEAVLAKLRPVPVNTKLCAQALRLNVPVRGYSSFAGLPLLHVHVRPLSGWSGVLKTVEDYLLGAVILVLMLPVLAACAIAVKLSSPGPILFRQKRYGFNNNEITVFKFRSMVVDQPPDPKVTQARRGDPRITRVGAFLRKTSLDELPQLFNVLRGEMSLVGPRPHAVAHNEQYAKMIDGYLGRHRVKPGITGWAQVNGFRGETDTVEKMRMRVQYDLYYIDHWSLVFDLKILSLTALVGFVNRNAY